MRIDKTTLRDGTFESDCFTLQNDSGMRVSALCYGCIITEITVPDKNGKFENVVLGFDNLSDYIHRSPYYGAVVGRVAGRISGGEFELSGEHYSLPKNEGNNHLHGNGEFNTALWHAEPEEGEDYVAVKFSHTSRGGTNGYPGTVAVNVTYRLNNDNQLTIFFEACSDKDTILNLTNHSYFNLTGDCNKTIGAHKLFADIESYVALREDLIPTGELANARGTVFDFSIGRELLGGITSAHSQILTAGGGYDHALVFAGDFDDCKGTNLATLSEPESGRIMTMETSYPCFVLYSGNQLENKHTGVCLEAQLLPDAPHNPQFGSIVLKACDVYSHVTSYKFAIDS